MANSKTTTTVAPEAPDSQPFAVVVSSPLEVKPGDRLEKIKVTDPKDSSKKLELGGRRLIFNQPVVRVTSGPFRGVVFRANRIHAFATGGAKIDAYYLDQTNLELDQLSLFGTVLLKPALGFQYLTNHPLISPTRRWTGQVAIHAEGLQVPALPALKIAAPASNTDPKPLSLSFDFSTKTLALSAAAVSYSDPKIVVSGSGSLRLTAPSATTSQSPGTTPTSPTSSPAPTTPASPTPTAGSLSLSGSGEIQVPGSGFPVLKGALSVLASDQALKSVSLRLDASSPMPGLGLSGTLEFSHDVQLGQGSIGVSNGQLLGLGVDGRLVYGGGAVKGSLTLKNRELKALPLGLSGFSLTPLAGTINYASAQSGSSNESGTGSLEFRDVSFELAVAGQSLTLSGNVDLDLPAGRAPALRQADLSLAKDVSTSINGFKIKLLGSQKPNAVDATKVSLKSVNGVLRPSFSGAIEFEDLNKLRLTIPEGGLIYGDQGWELNDVTLGLGKELDIGSIRFGPQASARYQNGILSVNPDLSVNLDSLGYALKPIAQMINDYVAPLTTPIVKLYKTGLDVASRPKAKAFAKDVRRITTVNLQPIWTGLVKYIESVPGNVYKDGKLTAGELADFAAYRAFEFVVKNPGLVNSGFKELFGTDLPSWLQDLPKGLEPSAYAAISMSATVSRLEAINQLAAALSAPVTNSGQWTPVPFSFQLAANQSKPAFDGGEEARKQLIDELNKANAQLAQLQSITPATQSQSSASFKKLPLQFNADLAVPLFKDPFDVLGKMIARQPFDVVRADFTLGSSAELNAGLPLAILTTGVPQLAPLTAALKAVNAAVDLRAGLGAELSASLGLTTSLDRLAYVAKQPTSAKAMGKALIKAFSGFDPVTGLPLGLYLGETPGKPLLSIKPSIDVGLGMSRGGVSGRLFALAKGSLNLGLQTRDGRQRLYLSDASKALASLPGIKVSAKVDGAVGLDLRTALGSMKPMDEFPILGETNLFATKPVALA